MAIQKFTTLQLNGDASIPVAAGVPSVEGAKLSDFEFTPEPGFLYVTTRAISSRVNANHDGWPPEEIRKSYMTFLGRPTYVDHNNWDLKRSRGVVIDAKLYENKLASGHEDVWVALLIEVDAQAFPKLAQAILDGDIDSVSMGADVEYTVCSVCGNQAHDVLQYCAHIPQMKGRVIETIDKLAGKRIKKLCYEDCYGVSFFEISFVFDPADESALISDVMLASAGNRSLAHVRAPRESIAVYSERLGTSMMKVASVRSPDFCITCGGTDLAISKTGTKCLDCKFEFTADKVLMSLPQEVDTLRDELNCPQCGAEWNGMVCTNCGFELPPEGLGDPDTDPFGLAMPVGKPEGDQQDEGEQAGGAQGPPSDSSDDSDEDDSGQKAPPSKQDSQKPKKKDDSKGKDKKEPPAKAKDKKKSGKEDHIVSRFDSFSKEATLPQDPTYRQDTSPANSVPPYGQAIPGGTPLEGFEPALEPAPAAPAVVQDLDAPDVQGPVGQSAVTVVNQPPGPVDIPPPGSQAGEALNSQGQGKAASQQDRKAEFFRERASALRERAEEFEKKAEAIYQTDVRDLDAPPPVDVGADATEDVMKAIEQPEQLLLADTPDVINSGEATGLPAGPAFRERLPQQVNPFNDAALRPYEPVNPQVEASAKEAAKCKAGCECPDGSCNCGDCKLSKGKKSSVEDEAARVAEAKAREDQRVAAAKTRVLRIANFVDERIDMDLTVPAEKYADIARFEELDDATLDGYIQATREFKAKEVRVAGKRIRVAASEDRGPIRMPSLGRVSSPVVDEDDPADDYVAFL